MSKPFKVGIAGLGTVGVGVIKILTQNADIIAARAGRPIEIMAVSARSKDADRGVDISGFAWVGDARELASYGDIDAVVELIGGEDGVAADLVNAALDNSRHVITANKALIAHHGYEMAKKAEDNGVSLAYEAAVAGGIPIIKAMREGLAANKINAVYGILNGTCNYILTIMRETGRDFDDVLKDAQELGYAEADPAFDIEGVDAAHKLCILTSIAFGVKPDFAALQSDGKIQGITNINATDINCSTEFGYRIKLLGISRNIDGKIMQVVEPCLVPKLSPMGTIEDVYNAIYVDGDFVDTALFTGRGAGEGPTASSVVADIIDIARGVNIPTFGIGVDMLKDAQWADLGRISSRYYLRFNVVDEAGVIADVSSILKDLEISIESMVQHGHDTGQSVAIVIITHETCHGDMLKALSRIKALESCTENPCLMRIEEIQSGKITNGLE